MKSVIENVGALFAGRTPTIWTLDELSKAAETGMKGRNFETGKKMFSAAACYACHRFGSQGGMMGPDLTSAGRRYSPRDLLDQIIHPSKVINDQFSAVQVLTVDGLMHTGVVVNLGTRRQGESMTLNTDLTDPNKRVNIDRKQIEELAISMVYQIILGFNCLFWTRFDAYADAFGRNTVFVYTHEHLGPFQDGI